MEPLDTIRTAYDAYEAGNFAQVFALLSPSIVITQTDLLPWGGEHRGHEGAREFFRLLGVHTDARPHPVEFVPAGNQVAVFGRLKGSARASGKPIDLAIVHLWTVEGGLITRFEAYIDTPAMLDALAAD
ncbi:MAG: nuclear transport factor 2 family protein [Armatimonadetes bacterium]|nr:nuclear transport factor 2 family protein [Armatimonadota bacterium]